MAETDISPQQIRIRDLLMKRGAYTDDEVEELRHLAVEVGTLPTADWHYIANFRGAVETIAAIKQFDKASARLTSHGIWVMWLTLLVALVSLFVSVVALIRASQ